MVNNKRCIFYVRDKKSKKIRRCKNQCVHNLLCTKHSINNSKISKTEESIYDELGYGICCFCYGECNPLSQACGRCMRCL